MPQLIVLVTTPPKISVTLSNSLLLSPVKGIAIGPAEVFRCR